MIRRLLKKILPIGIVLSILGATFNFLWVADTGMHIIFLPFLIGEMNVYVFNDIMAASGIIMVIIRELLSWCEGRKKR